MKSARERMDIVSAFEQVGTYRAAAALCGTTQKTVRRVVEARAAGERFTLPPDAATSHGQPREPRPALRTGPRKMNILG